jgi:hypothetical protein
VWRQSNISFHCSIVSPTANQSLGGSSTNLRVRLDPTPDPVKRVTIRVNGRVVVEQVPDRGEGETVLSVPLAKGDNAISVVAGSDVGDTTAEVRVNLNGAGQLDQRNTLYVVAVGVDKYPALNICGADGQSTCNLSFSGSDPALCRHHH